MKIRMSFWIGFLQTTIIGSTYLHAINGELSELKGSISLVLEAGTPEKPFFWVGSSSLKGKAVFRGQVKQTVDQNISFYEVPNLLDPDETESPFKDGMLSSVQARATVSLESNGTLAQDVSIDFPGQNYLSSPEVYVELPTSGTDSSTDFKKASLSAQVDPVNGTVTSITVDEPGLGYEVAPRVTIEGGPHFIRLVDQNSEHRGNFFKIIANDGSTLLVDNPLQVDLTEVFQPNQLVEIYEAWTLGSLFGHTADQVLFAEGNSSDPEDADGVYLLKSNNDQNGSIGDFVFFYHDGNIWRSEEDPSRLDSADSVIIHPDQSFILARRTPEPLELIFSGNATTDNTFGSFPQHLKRKLLSNPYGVEVMLSDLISTKSITSDIAETDKWLAHPSQEIADNIKILSGNVWTTYWNDGTNRLVTEVARATARFGTGVGGGLTQQDISIAEGTITDMTNPATSNIIVTSLSHGLKSGFTVFITGAEGYKTNEEKEQVDENGNLVSDGAVQLVIESVANGFYEISVIDNDRFEILGKSGNCDFINNGQTTWSTGSRGQGYTSDAFVSFVGGGGKGAKGIARVDSSSGQITSILITESGAGYSSSPKVFIHSGGWKKLGSGNAPFNDVLIPAGSGILLVRNHSAGVRSLFEIKSPLLNN